MPGSADATTPLSGGGPGSSAGGSAKAIGAVPSGISEQAASAATRFNMFLFRSSSTARSDGLGDAVVGDDVVGVVRRARHCRVRPQERLTEAAVHLDVGVLEGDAHGCGLVLLFVHGDGGHRARLGVDLDLAGEREADTRWDDAAGE